MALNSDQVTALQRALVARGYSVGPTGADGRFGPNTLRALQNFQRAAGLNIRYDYEVDSQTAAALGLNFTTWQGVGNLPGGRYAGANVTGTVTPAEQGWLASVLKSAAVMGPGGRVALDFTSALATGVFTEVSGMPGHFRNAAGNLFRKVSDGARYLLIPADPGALDWLLKLGIVATSVMAIGPLIGLGIFGLLLYSYLSDE